MALKKEILPVPLLLVFLGIVVIAILYNSTLAVFHLRWSGESSAFSHGYLLVPVSLWLIYQEWMARQPSFKIEWFPIVLIGAVSFTWFAGRVVTVEFAEQSAVILLCALLVPALIGYKNSFRILLPILFLFTTIPIIETLAGDHLQKLTAIVSGFLLNLFGVRTFQDGFLLMIPAGSFVVERSCSGIRYQIAAISLVLIDAYMSRMNYKYFVLYVLLAVATAFIANSIRIIIILSVAQMTNMQTSLVDDHLWLGWVIFSILMPIVILMWHKFVAFGILEEEKVQSAMVSTYIDLVTPRNILSLVVLFLVLSIGPILEYVLQPKQLDGDQFSDYPELIIDQSRWRQTTTDQEYWAPKVMEENASIQKRYEKIVDKSGAEIDVYIGHYASQKNDREAINVVNKVSDTKVWSIVSKHRDQAIGENDFQVEETLIRKGSTERLIWRWYNVGGKFVGSPMRAKILNFTSTLVGRTDITTYMLAVDVNNNIDSSADDLRAFFTENESVLKDWVERVRISQKPMVQ